MRKENKLSFELCIGTQLRIVYGCNILHAVSFNTAESQSFNFCSLYSLFSHRQRRKCIYLLLPRHSQPPFGALLKHRSKIRINAFPMRVYYYRKSDRKHWFYMRGIVAVTTTANIEYNAQCSHAFHSWSDYYILRHHRNHWIEWKLNICAGEPSASVLCSECVYLLAMDQHRTDHTICRNDIANHRSDTSSKFQYGIRKWTCMRMPFGIMEL